MVTTELLDYIQKARAAGQTDEQISQSLIQAGWQPADIQAALVNNQPSITPGQSTMNWKKILGIKTKEELRKIVASTLRQHPLPEEIIVDFNIVHERPSLWWGTLLGFLWALLIKTYILVLTNRRLILIRLGLLYNQPKSFAEYPRDNIQFIGFSHLLTTSKLILRLPDGKRRNYFFVKNENWRTTAEIIAASLSGRPVEEIRKLGYRNKRKSIIKQLLMLVIVIILLIWIYTIGSRKNSQQINCPAGTYLTACFQGPCCCPAETKCD